jgi:hypothetical protein
LHLLSFPGCVCLSSIFHFLSDVILPLIHVYLLLSSSFKDPGETYYRVFSKTLAKLITDIWPPFCTIQRYSRIAIFHMMILLLHNKYETLGCDHTEADQTRPICLFGTLITDLNGGDPIA